MPLRAILSKYRPGTWKCISFCFLSFKNYVLSLQHKNTTLLLVFFFFSRSHFLSLFSLFCVIFGVIESLIRVCCSKRRLFSLAGFSKIQVYVCICMIQLNLVPPSNKCPFLISAPPLLVPPPTPSLEDNTLETYGIKEIDVEDIKV